MYKRDALFWNRFLRYELTIQGTNFIKARFMYSIVPEKNKVCIHGANSIKMGHDGR